jgi:hypothetical protein
MLPLSSFHSLVSRDRASARDSFSALEAASFLKVNVMDGEPGCTTMRLADGCIGASEEAAALLDGCTSSSSSSESEGWSRPTKTTADEAFDDVLGKAPEALLVPGSMLRPGCAGVVAAGKSISNVVVTFTLAAPAWAADLKTESTGSLTMPCAGASSGGTRQPTTTDGPCDGSPFGRIPSHVSSVVHGTVALGLRLIPPACVVGLV